YFDTVSQGLLAGLYVESWRDHDVDAVFVGPAHTFLLRNRPVDVQFWLDVGSLGWWERIDQPLTHPYVLSPRWPEGALWTDADEYEHQQDMLYRIVSGLLRRCRERVYLGISDLGEQGFEQRGPMLRVFQRILRRHPTRIEMPGEEQGVKRATRPLLVEGETPRLNVATPYPRITTWVWARRKSAEAGGQRSHSAMRRRPSSSMRAARWVSRRCRAAAGRLRCRTWQRGSSNGWRRTGAATSRRC